MSASNLFKEFKSRRKTEWLDKIIADQKGRPIESLNWDFDDRNISPFYHSEDLSKKNVTSDRSRQDNTWQIGEFFEVADSKNTNKSLINALELGVAALYIDVGNAKQDEVMQFLSGVQHEWISTHLDLFSSDKALQAFQYCCNVLRENEQDLTKVDGSVRLSTQDKSYWLTLKEVFTSLPNFKVLLNPECDGEDDISKTALNVLTNTYDFFQKGQQNGVLLNTLFNKLQFKIAVGDKFYENIILLRSVRLLVTQLCNTYGVPFESSISIETWLKKSDQTEDANYNLIKNTSQILSAVIGGVDYVYSSCINVNSNMKDVDNRKNRNISHVLQLESYMNRVDDPASGSYFFETLTDQLCKNVWEEFQNRVEA